MKLSADAHIPLRAARLLALALAVGADLVLLNTVRVHFEVRADDAASMHACHELLGSVRREPPVVVDVVLIRHVLIVLQGLVIVDLLGRDIGLVRLFDRRLHVLRHECLGLLVAIDDLAVGRELVEVRVLHRRLLLDA